MKLKPPQRVPLLVAKERAMAALFRYQGEPVNAAALAGDIWPGHDMTAQGAGGAASRVLKALEKEGRARWVSKRGRWGWVS